MNFIFIHILRVAANYVLQHMSLITSLITWAKYLFILLIWQLWNELEFYVSEQADEEVSVETLANQWENIAKCFVDDDLDKGRQPLILNYH